MTGCSAGAGRSLGSSVAQWAAHSCVAHRPSRRPWPADRRALCRPGCRPASTRPSRPSSSTSPPARARRPSPRRSSAAHAGPRGASSDGEGAGPAARRGRRTSGRWLGTAPLDHGAGAQRPPVVPGRLDQEPAGVGVAGLGDRPAAVAGPRLGLGGHQAQVGADAGARKPTPVADLDRQGEGGQRARPRAGTHRRPTTGAKRGSAASSAICRSRPSRRRPAARTAP